MGPDAEKLLADPVACTRIIQDLRTGRPPRQGLLYLTVGLDRTIEELSGMFEAARGGSARFLWVTGDPGEGKSHLLGLLEELARRNRFVWAGLVHDPTRQLGLHKPGRLLREVVLRLQRHYPEVNLDGWRWLTGDGSADRADRLVREGLTDRLRELVRDVYLFAPGPALCRALPGH
jgi:hypothetical protein